MRRVHHTGFDSDTSKRVADRRGGWGGVRYTEIGAIRIYSKIRNTLRFFTSFLHRAPVAHRARWMQAPTAGYGHTVHCARYEETGDKWHMKDSLDFVVEVVHNRVVADLEFGWADEAAAIGVSCEVACTLDGAIILADGFIVGNADPPPMW